MSEEPRVETRKQQGFVTALIDGETKRVPITLTIIDTYYASGRKDCTIQVPRLRVNPKANPKEDANAT